MDYEVIASAALKCEAFRSMSDEAGNHEEADSFGDYEVMASSALKHEAFHSDCMSTQPQDHQELQQHYQKLMGNNPQCTSEVIGRNIGRDSVEISEFKYMPNSMQRADNFIYCHTTSGINNRNCQFSLPMSVLVMVGHSHINIHCMI